MSRCFCLYISFLFAVLVALPLRAAASWQPEISIGLTHGISEARFTATKGSLYVYENLENKEILKLPQGKELDIRMIGRKFFVNGKEVKSDRLIIQPDDGFVKVNGAAYRGYITLLKKSGFTIINNVQVEDYLYGVVPKEMPPSWSSESLQAQSVAARTFALKNRKRHIAEGFDLCNTSHCQVYDGMAAETGTTTEAVNRTRGEVLFYKGAIIDALFHTDSGGMTESSEYVWGSLVPYLRGVNEVQTQTQEWSRTIPMTVAVKSFEKDGKIIAPLREVRLSRLDIGRGSGDRSPSGRVRSADFVGPKGHVLISGNELRSMFSLPSTLFDIRLGKTELFFSGYGSGYGLGLSQWGAKTLADRGKSYKDILFHYYTGVTLEKLY